MKKQTQGSELSSSLTEKYIAVFEYDMPKTFDVVEKFFAVENRLYDIIKFRYGQDICLCHNSFTIALSTPFKNFDDFSVLYSFESSIASLIATAVGV